MEIFGLSLTTWLILLGVFAVVTPIVGKQVAKDALKVKDSLQSPNDNSVILFPGEHIGNLKKVGAKSPVQSLTEEKYIRRMMMGGVWAKFLYNIGMPILIFLMVIFVSILYSIEAFFRGIFSIFRGIFSTK